MPLTFAHPAAILLGYRWRHRGFPFAALVIGSMSPDFEYFLRLEPMAHFSHTLLGVFVFCLPLGLIVHEFCQRFILPTLPALLPPPVQRRCPKNKGSIQTPVRRWALAASAIVLGAITHIVWDSFTHANGAVVVHAPVLRMLVLGIPIYKILQHGSTLLGFLALTLWFFGLSAHDGRGLRRVAPMAYFMLTVAFLVYFAVLAGIFPPVSVGRLVVEIIDAALLAVATICLWSRRTMPQ